MDSITKQHIISGVIGGVTTLVLAIGIRKLMWRRHWKRRGGSKVVTMQAESLPKPVGPFSPGKMIQYPHGSQLAYSSGQLGIDPATS